MNKKLHFVVLLSCFCIFVYAQVSSPSGINTTTSEIRAFVVDSLENDTIASATVSLYNKKDSSLVKTVLTDNKGEFVFKDIKPSLYYLRIQFLGYAQLTVHIPEELFSSEEINLGTLNMHYSAIELNEVVITAQIPEFVIKGDTTEYNAAAFRTGEGAIVEDLLKQLPGLEVDAVGGIKTVDGKTVSRVFVNDKEFFGNDPKMATKNLPANIVDKVQVIEKKSDLAILTGVEDDNRETIINIKVKKGLFGGWMGNVDAGAGGLIDNPTDESTRYKLQSTLNRFTEENQTFVGVYSDNISGGSGITKTTNIVVHNIQKINDKFEIGGNMSYNYSDNYSSNKSFSQNFLRSVDSSEIDSTFYTRSASTSNYYYNNYDFMSSISYKDSLTTINIRPSVSYNSNRSRSFSERKTMGGDIDSTLINQSNSTDLSNSSGFNIRMNLDASRKLSATGRMVSLSGSFSTNSNHGDGSKVSANEFFSNTVENEYIDQISTSKSNNYSYDFSASYVEPLSKTNYLNFSYNIRLNNNNNTNNALNYDELTGDFTKRNAKYSRTSESMSTSQNIRVNFNSNKEKYNYNIGLAISPNYSQNKIYVDDWFGTGLDSIISSLDDRKVVNIAPSINFNYRLGGTVVQKNLRFQYNGNTRHPSTSQLSASDNTNPLNTIQGNPDLIPAFSNNLSLGYNLNNRNTQRSISFNGNFSFIMNDIINYITYHDGGKMTTTYINQNGNWNGGGSVTFSTPLDSKKKLRLNATSSYSFQNTVGYSRVSNRDENNKTVLSSEKNITKTSNISESLNLNYSNKWFYGQLRANIRYNNRNSTLNSTNAVNTYNYGISYNNQITLPLKISLSSDINWSANRGLSSGYNRNQALWNAQINKTLLKGNGNLRLQVNDILRQRMSISHTESAYSIQDSESIVLTSYFLLTFTYRFNKIGGG